MPYSKVEFGGEGRMMPVYVLVNYWEIHPCDLRSTVNELVQEGIRSVASFVPWQAFESDISHGLSKWIHVCTEASITLTLIPTPELGVHERFSGIPKDLFSGASNLAKDQHGQSIANFTGPAPFLLPSLQSVEVRKKLLGYLGRFHVFLSDLGRTHPKTLAKLEVLTTSSFWKYYRALGENVTDPFGGACFDASDASVLHFRKWIEEHFQQSEFTGHLSQSESVQRIQYWKSSRFDRRNREQFSQISESQFRVRVMQTLDRNPSKLRVVPVELYSPEADPSIQISTVLQGLAGGFADAHRLGSLLDSYLAGYSGSSATEYPPYIYWTATGGFRRLSDAEKQYLFLKSLLQSGIQGGGVLIDHSEWAGFSQAFKSRVDHLSRSLKSRRYHTERKVLYLGNHLWSRNEYWREVSRRAGRTAQFAANSEVFIHDTLSRVLILDPSCTVDRAVLRDVLGWLREGRTVCFPKRALYSDSAKKVLDDLIRRARRSYRLEIGLPYELLDFPKGKFLIYDLPEEWAAEKKLEHWQLFLESVFALGEIQSICRVSDPRIQVIAFHKKMGEGRGLALFLLNGSSSRIMTELLFPVEVHLSDLALSLKTNEESASTATRGERFQIEVPPSGVVPLFVEGLSDDKHDQLQVALSEARHGS